MNKTNLIGRNCLIFRYARSFDFAQDDKEKMILYAPEMKAYSECTYKRTVRLRRRIQSALKFACIKKKGLLSFFLCMVVSNIQCLLIDFVLWNAAVLSDFFHGVLFVHAHAHVVTDMFFDG